MDKNVKHCFFVLSFLILTACTRREIPKCDDRIGLYTLSNFPIGAAIDMNALESDSVYKSIAIQQFNSITPENIFKADNLHPDPSFFNWTQADSLVAFAEKYNKIVYGHTLIWHQQLPVWMLEYQGNARQWETLMKTHIQTIVSHFKGKVSAWEVVNEAFNEDGTLRNSIWLQKIGPGYIEKAFAFAHEADPDALLFYNDFNLEMNPAKRKSVLTLLNNLRNRGIKVDGIGMQMHISNAYPEPSQIADALKEVAKYNFKLHVSELDIAVNPLNKDIQPDKKLLLEQADVLGNLVISYKQIPNALQYGITFWGISDKYSWIRYFYNRNDYPLLYDDHFNPKPCYCKLLEVL